MNSGNPPFSGRERPATDRESMQVRALHALGDLPEPDAGVIAEMYAKAIYRGLRLSVSDARALHRTAWSQRDRMPIALRPIVLVAPRLNPIGAPAPLCEDPGAGAHGPTDNGKEPA
jgi:hypothetical protein